MKKENINIRDPFVLVEDETYYMYGTRGKNFGQHVGGFDVYVSKDLETWSDPRPCFTAAEYGIRSVVFWAPEVHKYQGAYYMFATFTQENGLRGTYVMRAESPMGPFVPHSKGALTPHEWECLDGTLYVENGVPYLVFCHEHTQILDGTVCYLQLSQDLSYAEGEPVLLFHGSDPDYIEKQEDGSHYVTDGPFLIQDNQRLLLLWSTFINHNYAECLVEFPTGSLLGPHRHLPPLIRDDGGHGMVFTANGKRILTFHTPNASEKEHPFFCMFDPLLNQ